MATTSVTLVPGAASNQAVMSGDPSRGGALALRLQDGDSMVLSIGAGFPGDTVFSSITFYPNSAEVPSDNSATVVLGARPAGSAAIGGYRSGQSIPVPLVNIAWTPANLAQPLTITDSDGQASATTPDSTWFSVTLGSASRGASWRLDPELVNTSGSSTGWGSPQGANLSRVFAA